MLQDCTSQEAGSGNSFTVHHMSESNEEQVLAKGSRENMGSYTPHIKTQQIFMSMENQQGLDF